VAGKLLTSATPPVFIALRVKYSLAALVLGGAFGAWSAELSDTPRFLGELSCSSSSCHGGARAGFDQFTAWKHRDVHTRSYATLTTPLSQRIGELLKLDRPTSSARCTVCHAPFQEVPASLRGTNLQAEAGVACESCHNAAEPWVRTHTRPDLSHADRVAAGLRDLKNPYYRANTCVACHQNLEPDLRDAGHPVLFFELDGQSVTQPRHWRERSRQSGGQMWLVGQAVALREMSWHLERAPAPDAAAVARWKGLVWLLLRTANTITNLVQIVESAPEATPTSPTLANFQRTRELSDALARRAAALDWPSAVNERLLRELAGATNDFADAALPRLVQACRAERLVLGLDRLLVALGNTQAAGALDAALQALFSAVQSVPDFDSAAFAKRLAAFSNALPPHLAGEARTPGSVR
jgi:hypothetical protein